jgi:hypothetical protein
VNAERGKYEEEAEEKKGRRHFPVFALGGK